MAKGKPSHDSLYKETFGYLFPQAVELFLPDLFPLMEIKDFKPSDLLPQEIRINNETRIVDMLAETTIEGEKVLFHVEFQSSRVPEYNKKMFDYYIRLLIKNKCMVIPIVVYSHDSGVTEPDCFTLERDYIKTIDFYFHSIQLTQKYWRDYVDTDNPIAAGLIAAMFHREDERIEMMMESIRIIEANDLDEPVIALLLNLFDSYIQFTTEEKRIIKNLVQKKYGKRGVDLYVDRTKLKEIYPFTYREGEEKGIEKGRNQTITICKMLVKGRSLKEISNETGLTIEEIETIRSELFEM